MVMKGDELAKTGKLNDTVVIYQKARKIDPDFNLVPKMRAEELGKQAAPYLVEKGKEIARIGNLDKAIKHFQKTLQLDPSLDMAPKEEAERLAAKRLLEENGNVFSFSKIEANSSTKLNIRSLLFYVLNRKYSSYSSKSIIFANSRLTTSMSC